jgi:transposase
MSQAPGDLAVGIDIGKTRHFAALLSRPLLERYKRFDACPTMPVENSRSGFEHLLAFLDRHAPRSKTHVLLEQTGHYGRALEQYLQEHDLALYRLHVTTRAEHEKSDKRDAQALAILLYNQVVLHAVADPTHEIRRLIAPSPTATLLRGLVQHRLELVCETTRRKNKLTAIADELFPEFTAIFADPNSPSALQLRAAFPTPQAIASASLDDLCATRKRTLPSRAKLAELQELARATIGTKSVARLVSLQLEQKQLMAELALLDDHVEQLSTEIERQVRQSREGRILTSFIGIGSVHAATLIAGIGSIANFESKAKLRAYLGWAPHEEQTGTTSDTRFQMPGGNPLLKQTMYLVTIAAIRYDPTWRALYERLLPIKCQYDERKKEYKGKMKVIGRIAGQIIGVIYILLSRDADLVASFPPGAELPPPELYDPSKHQIRKG